MRDSKTKRIEKRQHLQKSCQVEFQFTVEKLLQIVKKLFLTRYMS